MAGTRKHNAEAAARVLVQEQTTATLAVQEERRLRARSPRPGTREGKQDVLIYVSPGLSRQLPQVVSTTTGPCRLSGTKPLRISLCGDDITPQRIGRSTIIAMPGNQGPIFP